MNNFWNKVSKCNHRDINPNYIDSGSCDTPYCDWYEEHCLDCGAYIIKCGCGFCNAVNGWPRKRNIKKFYLKGDN